MSSVVILLHDGTFLGGGTNTWASVDNRGFITLGDCLRVILDVLGELLDLAGGSVFE